MLSQRGSRMTSVGQEGSGAAGQLSSAALIGRALPEAALALAAPPPRSRWSCGCHRRGDVRPILLEVLSKHGGELPGLGIVRPGIGPRLPRREELSGHVLDFARNFESEHRI